MPLLKDIFADGELVYELPHLEKIKAHAKESLTALWDEYKRILNPEAYPVDLSQKAYDNKLAIIKETRKKMKALENK